MRATPVSLGAPAQGRAAQSLFTVPIVLLPGVEAVPAQVRDTRAGRPGVRCT